jgi:hypothetical protein
VWRKERLRRRLDIPAGFKIVNTLSFENPSTIKCSIRYIENNTWCAEIPDLFRVLNMISHERQRTSEISCSTREINLVFPSTMYFSVYYINKIQWKTIKHPWQCVLQQMIFSHVKIWYFLRVIKYDFSQWPKTLYNTYVYIIKYPASKVLSYFFSARHGEARETLQNLCIFFVEPTIQKLG